MYQHTVTGYKGYQICIDEDQGFNQWGSGLAIRYHVLIADGSTTYRRHFFKSLTSSFDTKPQHSMVSLIEKKLHEVVDEKLLDHPDYQEFVYADGEFQGVIDCTA